MKRSRLRALAPAARHNPGIGIVRKRANSNATRANALFDATQKSLQSEPEGAEMYDECGQGERHETRRRMLLRRGSLSPKARRC
jgi:hypothetical protein